MGVRTYDPSQCVLIFGGAPITGFADGTFIEIDRAEDAFTKNVGADGGISRAKSNNRTGSVTITIQQTSPANDILSGIFQADDKANVGVLPLIFRDSSGRSFTVTDSAWIRKLPPRTYSKGIEVRVWILDTGRTEDFVGGNGPIDINQIMSQFSTLVSI